MPAGLYVYHIYAGTLGGQKKVSESLEWGLEVLVSHLMWLQGTKPWYSANSNALTHWTTFPAPVFARFNGILVTLKS